MDAGSGQFYRWCQIVMIRRQEERAEWQHLNFTLSFLFPGIWLSVRDLGFGHDIYRLLVVGVSWY
jgi:hypothetical protein